MLMFWLMSIYACILFNEECVCMSGCVCACVCLLHDLQCVCVFVCVCVCACTVLRDAAGSCAWSGDVMMSCGFLVSLLSLFFLLCLVNLLATILRCLLIFYYYKTSKIGGFL